MTKQTHRAPTVLFKVLYCEIKNVFIFVFSFMYYLYKRYYKPIIVHFYIANCVTLLGFPYSSVGKESACNAGDPGSIPGLGRSPGEGNGNPLQYSCLGNLTDRGAW